MTETELHHKRHERTMRSRAKRKARWNRYGEAIKAAAVRRQNGQSWLAKLGFEQQEAESARQTAYKQALESRQARLAISKPTKKGLIGAVKSFFRRRP